MSCNPMTQSSKNQLFHWHQDMERKHEDQTRKMKELQSHVEAHNEIMTSRGLRSEKAANLENVLSTKFSLKHSLSIFVIAHLKSSNDAVNDLSGSV